MLVKSSTNPKKDVYLILWYPIESKNIKNYEFLFPSNLTLKKSKIKLKQLEKLKDKLSLSLPPPSLPIYISGLTDKPAKLMNRVT